MPTNSNVLPTAASGWTNSNNILLDDGTNATDTNAAMVWDGSAWVFNNSASLLASSFTNLDAGMLTGDRVDGVQIEVQIGYTSIPYDTLYVYLYNGGSQIAGTTGKTASASGGAGIATVTLGGAADLWGAGSLTKANITNLQVLVIAAKTSSPGTADLICDCVKASVTYTEIRPTVSAAFTDEVGADPFTAYESNVITISGLGVGNSTTATFTGNNTSPAYVSLNSSAYGLYPIPVGGTLTIPSIVDGDYLNIWLYSEAVYSAGPHIDFSLASGYVTDTWTITCRAEDQTPSAFTFVDEPAAGAGTVVTSNTVQMLGFDSTYLPAISVVGGEYRVYNGGTWGAWRSTASTVFLNDYAQVRGTASGTAGGIVDVVLTVGGVSDTFRITTSSDPWCDQFFFTNVSGAAPLTAYVSNLVTVAGMLGSQTINAVSWGTVGLAEIRINGGAWQAIPYAGSVSQGDTIELQFTTAAANPASGGISVYIAGTTGTSADWTVSTGVADTTPDAFTFTDVTNARRNYLYTSNAITIAGLTGGYNAPVSITPGFEMQKNAGAWTSNTTGTFVTNGDTIKVRLTSAEAPQRTTSVRVQIEGTTDTFSVTTGVPPPPQDF